MFKEFLKFIYYVLLDKSQLWRLRIAWLRWTKQAVVLNLHQVNDISSPFWPALTPEHFAALLDFGIKNFEITTISKLKSSNFRRVPLVLSFDDAFGDYATNVAPMLRRYQVKANLNLIGMLVNEEAESLWNIELYDFLSSAPLELINQIRFPGFESRLESTSRTAKSRYGLELSKFLKFKSKVEREKLLATIRPLYESVEFRKTPFLVASDLKKLRDVTEFGAHSHSHESMAFQPFSYFLEDTTRMSQCYDSLFGENPNIYAFPNGSYEQKHINQLLGTGFKYILTVAHQFAKPDSQIIPRITYHANSYSEARMRALGY